jgi:excisionase family DNA binding protein
LPTAKTPTRPRRRPPKAAPPEVAPEQLLVTVPQAAVMLVCSEALVWKLLERGRLKRVRMGTATRISRAAVEAYAAKGDPPKRPAK